MLSESTAAVFPIVGIGASAGGLEALEQFFRHAPADNGMAFVLVQHLDPNHASLLTEILQRTTTMPVVEALDQIPVEPNCVYVIPPNRDMAIFHGKLQLSVPNEPRGQRMPIDAFLRSLAEDQQENATGIILSGTGTDGTLGLRAILGAGGVTLVQEPATAKYDGMPTSAIQAGYATGEEAYSIAILLRELMEQSHQELKVQIYSTDLDDDAIAIARAGFYPPNIAQDVTPERLRRFFIKEDTGYHVRNEIREMVVFAIQNVIKDPPFTKLDLLSCRNLMIYLEPELQNRLIPAFHFALKPGGVLFLSPSESIGNHTELFSALNRKWKFYHATHSITTSRAAMTNVLSWSAETGGKAPEAAVSKPKETNFAELTRRVLVQYYAPASVVTDLQGDSLYVHGETGKYLRPAPGQASLNIVEMAREGLELELRAAIRAVASEGMPTLNREIQVKTNGGFTTVSLSVRPLPGLDDSQNLLLVSFQDVASPVIKPGRKRSAKPAELAHIEKLERDLAYMKESHQATIEEQQASNEELKSTNEEMQSTNEELQSTNEELITVNTELQAKIEQLASMQNDMKNLLDNTNIGTVFLDEQLIIRRFTREATHIYRLVPSDVGRPLSDIKSNLEGEELLTKAQTVLESLVPIEQEVRTDDGAWYLLRIQPYRTLDNIIEGVVLTFTDISKRIEAETAVQLARELAESIVDTIRAPLLVLDSDLQVVTANRAFYQYFQVMVADTVGRKIYDLGNNQWNIPALRELLEIILPRDQTVEGYVVEHDFPAIGHHKISLNARRIVGKANEPSLILLTTEDIGNESIKGNKA